MYSHRSVLRLRPPQPPASLRLVQNADDRGESRKGRTLWTVDWAPSGGLKRNGLLDPAQKALAFGARIAVTGAPIRTLAEMRQHFPDYNTEPNPNTIDPASMRRVDDSWSWNVNSQGLPPAGNPGPGLCEVYERLTSAKGGRR